MHVLVCRCRGVGLRYLSQLLSYLTVIEKVFDYTWAPAILLSPFPRDYRHMLAHLAFYMSARALPPALVLEQPAQQ